MTFRSYLTELAARGALARISAPISKTYEIAGVLKRLEPVPVLFEQVVESGFQVAGNLFCSKAAIAGYLGLPVSGLIPRLAQAIEQRASPQVVESGACQEVVDLAPDLDKLPLLRHCEGDGGNYISAGVMIARHTRYGQNLDFHRLMQFSPTELAVRVVKGRHFDRFLQEQKQLEVAVCVGVSPAVLAAAATSVALGVDEMEIANAIEPLQVTRAKTVDLYVPAEAEFVLEGTVSLERRHAEGPFVDLTETYDVVRQEPVFEVRAITHRQDAIWQALLPGALEHKLLMGMPREPTIYQKVNQVVRCLDVNISPGGCSWLHAVIQIEKHAEDDGVKAIEAAFAGHSSCKHVFVVDQDIDIYDLQAVEWALATRFQGDADMIVRPRQRGSSLDPSAEPVSCLTTKIGFDLTKPLKARGKSFDKAEFPQVELEKWGLVDRQVVKSADVQSGGRGVSKWN
jgi:2,5-furandicarboxylate decarboxylase 1